MGGYAAPAGAYTVPDATVRPSRVLGLTALILAIVAAVVTPLIVGITAFAIGRSLPYGITGANDLSVLSPVRDQVLWAELSFWVGTVLGIAAIVMGIIAIRKKQGRGPGIAAIVVAAVAAVIFFVVLFAAFVTGTTEGFATYTS